MKISRIKGRFQTIKITDYVQEEKAKVVDIVKGFCEEKHFYETHDGYRGLRGNEKIEITFQNDSIKISSTKHAILDGIEAAIQIQQ